VEVRSAASFSLALFIPAGTKPNGRLCGGQFTVIAADDIDRIETLLGWHASKCLDGICEGRSFYRNRVPGYVFFCEAPLVLENLITRSTVALPDA